MTSFARQVRRRQQAMMAKSDEGRLRLLNEPKSNFYVEAKQPVKSKGGIPGHLAKVSPRKVARSAVKAARRANRG